MTDPENTTLLAQAIEQAKREGSLQAQAETDGQSVTGEVSLKASGESWWLKFWAKVTARKDHKAEPSAGFEFTRKW